MKVSVFNNRLKVEDCKSNRQLLKSFAGYRKANSHEANCSFPLSLSAIEFLKEEWPEAKIDNSVENEIKKRFKPDISEIQAFKSPLTPFKHQEEALKLAASMPALGLLFEMGTGKTKAAVDIGFYKHLHKKVKRILVVAPIAVHTHWKKEINDNCSVNCGIRICLGNKSYREKLIQKEEKFELTWWIINYEALRIFEKELIELEFDMIIADESTKIKNFRTKQAKSLLKISKDTRHKLILTGTPIWNKPEDIFGQYLFLDPFVFGPSWTQFANQYMIKGGYMSYEVKEYKELEEMHNRIFSIALRKTKAECLDLPPRVYETRKVTMTEAQARLYHEAEKQCYIEIAEEFNKSDQPKAFIIQNVLVKLLRLQQIANGHIVTQEGEMLELDNPKLKELEYLLHNELDGKKVIVWCRFKQDIKQICKTLGNSAVPYHGELTPKKAQANLDKFRQDPNIKYFIGQFQKGGLGIQLTEADTAIFYSSDWSPGNRDQAEGRNHRKGSEIHQSITYIDLVAENTIDEEILAALKDKKEIIDIILDKIRVKK